MYKHIGLALLGIAAIMMIPAQSEANESDFKHWGYAHLVVFDAAGNEVMEQTVHNNLMDEGEVYIVRQAFKEGGANDEIVDNDQIASICLSDDATFVGFTPTLPTETEGAGTFDGNIGVTLAAATVCQDDAGVDISTPGAPVIGPLTFTYGTHTPGTGSHTITNIGICQADGSAGNTAFGDCQAAQAADSGILFGQIDVADFTLQNAGETAQIDYTFDIDDDTT